MDYVILLDRFAGRYGPNAYAVTFLGSLGECRAKSHHDNTTFPLPKKFYKPGESEPTNLLDPEGRPNAGQILRLIPTASLAMV
jgi:hypothetical protein